MDLRHLEKVLENLKKDIFEFEKILAELRGDASPKTDSIDTDIKDVIRNSPEGRVTLDELRKLVRRRDGEIRTARDKMLMLGELKVLIKGRKTYLYIPKT